MTDYRDINVKKALRHSCEVRYDRVQLIILAVFLAFYAMIMAGLISEQNKEVKEARHEVEWLEERKDDPKYAENEAMYRMQLWMAQEGLARCEQAGAMVVLATVIISIVFVSGIAYYAWRLYRTLHKPEGYEVCTGRLHNPTPAFGRGLVYFKADFTLPDGQIRERETRGVFSSSFMSLFNDMTTYDGHAVLIAYDPVEDRLAVLGTVKELRGE